MIVQITNIDTLKGKTIKEIKPIYIYYNDSFCLFFTDDTFCIFGVKIGYESDYEIILDDEMPEDSVLLNLDIISEKEYNERVLNRRKSDNEQIKKQELSELKRLQKKYGILR